MAQLQLPIFPAGVTEINSRIAVQKEAGRVFYIHGHLPVFQHEEQDVQSFRMFTSQMIVSGTAKPKDNKLWLREIRKLNDSGHQTSILTTNFQAPMATLAASLFARWSQENFFRYMREHYSLDRLMEYGTEPIPDAILVVNPEWRKLDSQIRSKTVPRSRLAAQFGALALSEDPTESDLPGFQHGNG